MRNRYNNRANFVFCAIKYGEGIKYEYFNEQKINKSWNLFLCSGGSQKYLNFKTLYEYVLRLDMIKPDPVKICKIDLDNFGLTADKR